MKTLIISFDKDFPIKTAGNLVVYIYDLINDLVYEVSNEVASCLESGFLGDKTALLSEFEKDRPSQYKDFINLLKSKLFNALSETNIPETLSLPFPEGYVDWLRYNTNTQFVEIGKSILENDYILKVNPKEIYEDYFIKGIISAVISIIKNYRDIKFVTVKDNDNVNLIVFKAIVQDFPDIKAVQYSDGRIQRMIGLAYYKGEGISQDFHKADEHFTKASEKLDADSFCYLGRLYEKGDGVQKDLSKAFHLYSESARLGSVLGKAYLGRAYHKGIGVEIDIPKAIEYYQAAAEAGIELAQENLGDIYYEGLEDQPNFEEAFKWYSINAKNKPSIKTQYRLGKILYEGVGREMNLKQAYQYLKKAAESNFEDSNFLCGQILEKKESEIHDEKESYHYYKQGADAGEYKSATEYAIYLKSQGKDVEIEPLLKYGIDKDYAKAQYELATHLIKFNKEEEAKQLLNLSSRNGYFSASVLLEELARKEFEKKVEQEAEEKRKLEEEKKVKEAFRRLLQEQKEQKRKEAEELEQKFQEEIRQKEKKEFEFNRLANEFVLKAQTEHAISLFNGRNSNHDNLSKAIKLLIKPARAGYPYARAWLGLILHLISPNEDTLSLIKSSITFDDASNIYKDFCNQYSDDLRKKNEQIIRENSQRIAHFFKKNWGMSIWLDNWMAPYVTSTFLFDDCCLILVYCYLNGIGVKKSLNKALEYLDKCNHQNKLLSSKMRPEGYTYRIVEIIGPSFFNELLLLRDLKKSLEKGLIKPQNLEKYYKQLKSNQNINYNLSVSFTPNDDWTIAFDEKGPYIHYYTLQEKDEIVYKRRLKIHGEVIENKKNFTSSILDRIKSFIKKN